MKIFKPLNFESDGYGDRVQASVSISYPVIYSLFSIQTDNAGNVNLSIFGSANLYDKAKNDHLFFSYLNTFENAEKVAQKLYQEGMNKLYDNIESLISL